MIFVSDLECSAICFIRSLITVAFIFIDPELSALRVGATGAAWGSGVGVGDSGVEVFLKFSPDSSWKSFGSSSTIFFS